MERQGSKDLLHSCGSFRVAHNEEFTVKEVDMSKSGVVVYLSGDY